ncbi:MAG TPA: TolC family protein [Methylomirabilota bacterium]|nr:TolC family protein [Methylomirabilota bacterium]
MGGWLAMVCLSLQTAWAEEGQESLASESGETRTLTLDDAYRLAIANEEQIKIAERELAKAQLLPWRAVALLTPRADVAGTYTRNKDEIAFTGNPSGGGGATTTFPSVIRPLESWQGIFSVTQPLIQPSFLPSWQLGKDSVRQNEQRYGFTIREVLFGVARAYYDVLRAQAQVGVAQDTLKLTQDELKQAQARFRVGEVTKTDVLRAEVEVARAERALITAGNNQELTLTVLARTVGVRGPIKVVEPAPPLSSGERYEQLLDKAYKQRQDLRAQEAAVEVARQRRNLVRARYFPSVGALWQFPKLDSPTFANRDEFWTLTLNFQVPVFDGGTRELDLLEQEENLAQSRLQFDLLKKDIGVEVRQALLSVETLAATLDTLKKEVNLAQENYNITSKQYRVGLATSLDVNTALNALNQVRTQLTDQTYAYQVGLLGLDRAVGVFAQDYVAQR